MKKPGILILTLVVAICVAGASQGKDAIKIGYFDWSDNLFITNVIDTILTERMDRETDLVKADPALVYQGVAEGELDFHADAWLPETHADYYSRVIDDVIDLGAVYTRAKLGWVVPEYIPEDAISSIEDLKSDEVRDKLDGRIVGIDPGAGLTRLSKQVMEDYGLSDFGYELSVSSDAGMTAALRRAIDNEEWIVVTGWSPHWKFGRWDVRYIADRRGTLGGIERADILARKGFYVDEPEVYEMLDRMLIPL